MPVCRSRLSRCKGQAEAGYLVLGTHGLPPPAIVSMRMGTGGREERSCAPASRPVKTACAVSTVRGLSRREVHSEKWCRRPPLHKAMTGISRLEGMPRNICKRMRKDAEEGAGAMILTCQSRPHRAHPARECRILHAVFAQAPRPETNRASSIGPPNQH